MTIADKLQLTLDTKAEIKQALVNKGLSPTDVFSTYPGLINGLSVGVATPEIVSPVDGATGVSLSPIITSSRFNGILQDGSADTHAASIWEFSNNADFTNIIHTSGRDTTNLESYYLTAVDIDPSVTPMAYVRVTYESSAGNLSTSPTISFSFTEFSAGSLVGGDIVAGQFNGNWVLVASESKRIRTRLGLYGKDTALPNITNEASVDPNSGEYNTDILTSAENSMYTYGAGITGSPAAEYCRTGMDKPYNVPNKEELLFVIDNLSLIDANDPDDGPNTLSWIRDNDELMSSTESSDIKAWAVDEIFDLRTQYKGNQLWLIPIRTIPV